MENPNAGLLVPGRLPFVVASLLILLAASTATTFADDDARRLTLDECLATAFERNHHRPASRFALAAAEAQHRQVLAAYWPQLSLQAGYEVLDEYRNFIFPSSPVPVPPMTVDVPAGTAFVTVPPGIFGPTAVQLPVGTPAQSLTLPGQSFEIPRQDIQLGSRSALAGSLDLTWLLLDGGLRAGLRAQARAGTAVAQQDLRRTDLEIVESVTRLYWTAVLARELRQLGADTLERMNATLQLTESVYQGGSGSVTKSDYLANKVMVETLRAMLATLEKNEVLAAAALANSMGLSWRESVAPADDEIPFAAASTDLPALVGQAYEFNPDWLSLQHALEAAAGAVQEARSGHAPQLALTGRLHRLENDYDAGFTTDRNKRGWTVGLGVRLPLFDGQLTRQKVAAARARLDELKEKRFLLEEGIGLQVRQAVLEIDAAVRAHTATLAARTAAAEDRDLNTRAYMDQLVETEKVIRAQLVESLMTAQHLKTRYDHAVLQARLHLLVGREMQRLLATAAPAR